MAAIPEHVYKSGCVVANPLVAMLHYHQEFFFDLARRDPSPAELYDAIRSRLSDPALVAAARIDPEQAALAALAVDELSKEFPGAVAEIMKDAWVTAYRGAQPFDLETGPPPQDEEADFTAAGRVRVTIDFDDKGVSMKIQHGLEHADWFSPTTDRVKLPTRPEYDS